MIKVLVIEDENTVRAGITELFEENGYRVFPASTGNEGIKLAAERDPDIIICDILMQGIDGYSVLNKIRSKAKTRAVPFIFLTAKTELSDLRLGMELGADDYVFKPYRAEDLLKAGNARLKRIKELKPSPFIEEGEKPEETGKKRTLTLEDRIFIKARGKPEILKIEEIVCIKANSDYSNIFLQNGTKYIIRKSLKNWEEILPEKHFIRVHRSIIVNLNYVKKLESWYKRSYVLHLKNYNEPVVISQRYAVKIKSRLMR